MTLRRERVNPAKKTTSSNTSNRTYAPGQNNHSEYQHVFWNKAHSKVANGSHHLKAKTIQTGPRQFQTKNTNNVSHTASERSMAVNGPRQSQTHGTYKTHHQRHKSSIDQQFNYSRSSSSEMNTNLSARCFNCYETNHVPIKNCKCDKPVHHKCGLEGHNEKHQTNFGHEEGAVKTVVEHSCVCSNIDVIVSDCTNKSNMNNLKNNGINVDNLICVNPSKLPSRSAMNLKFTIVNSRLVRNKSADISEYIIEGCYGGSSNL